MYIYICIHICMCAYICVYVYIYVHSWIYVYIYVHSWIYVYMHYAEIYMNIDMIDRCDMSHTYVIDAYQTSSIYIDTHTHIVPCFASVYRDAKAQDSPRENHRDLGLYWACWQWWRWRWCDISVVGWVTYASVIECHCLLKGNIYYDVWRMYIPKRTLHTPKRALPTLKRAIYKRGLYTCKSMKDRPR